MNDEQTLAKFLKEQRLIMIDDAFKYTDSTIDLLHCDDSMEDWQRSKVELSEISNIASCGTDLVDMGIQCKKECRIPMLAVFCVAASTPIGQLGYITTLDVNKQQFAYKRDNDGEWSEAEVAPDSPLRFVFESWAKYIDPELN